jgi:hypothetical protein
MAKYKTPVRKPEGNRHLRRPTCKWKDIRMDLREVGWEGVEWMHLAWDGDLQILDDR